MADRESQEIANIIDRYRAGTYAADEAMLRDVFHPDATMNGYLGDQLLMGGLDPFFDVLKSGPSMESEQAPYNVVITHLETEGNVASVTIDETGFTGGVNFTTYFMLMKLDGTWKITTKTFSTY